MRKLLLFVALVAFVGTAGVGPGPSPVEAGPPFHCNQVNLHPNGLQNGQLLVPYSDTLWITPANLATPITVFGIASGTLPTGLSLVAGPNPNEVTLQGVPTATGPFTFTVFVGGTYVLGAICNVTRTFTVTIL